MNIYSICVYTQKTIIVWLGAVAACFGHAIFCFDWPLIVYIYDIFFRSKKQDTYTHDEYILVLK